MLALSLGIFLEFLFASYEGFDLPACGSRGGAGGGAEEGWEEEGGRGAEGRGKEAGGGTGAEGKSVGKGEEDRT